MGMHMYFEILVKFTEKVRRKKPCNKPMLTEYGEAAKLTYGGASSVVSDHGNNHTYS